jgi:hypothetical protein
MRKLAILMTLLLVAIVLTSTVSAQDTIAVGETVQGEVTDGTVTHTFSATAGEIVIITIVTEGFEPTLEVEDADGWEVDFSFGGETFASLVFVAPEDGVYTILSQDFLDPVTGSYTLSLTSGGTIAAGETVEGTIDTATMAYAFSGTEGALIAASLTTEGFDSNLTLMNGEGDALKFEYTSDYSPNTAIEFLLPEDGTYVVAVELSSFSDSLTGTYTLSLAEITPTFVELDTPATIDIEGVEREYVAFKAAAGTVVHITADSGTTDEFTGPDTELELVGPDGEDMVSDSSDGPGADPAITRIILPLDGYYLLKVIPEDDDPELVGSVDVLVETTELLRVDEGPINLTLADRFDQDFVYYDAVEGSRYRLTVLPERNVVSFTISLGEGLFGGGSYLGATDVDRLVMDFTAEETGLQGISLRQSSWQDVTTYEVSLEPLE